MLPKITESYTSSTSTHGTVETLVDCILCQQQVPLTLATAGALYADGQQAFACYEHSQHKARWLVGWAHFAILQRAGLAQDVCNQESGL